MTHAAAAAEESSSKIRNYSLSAKNFSEETVSFMTENNISYFQVTGNTIGSPAQQLDFTISGNVPYLIVNQSGSQVNGYNPNASSSYSAQTYYRTTLI